MVPSSLADLEPLPSQSSIEYKKVRLPPRRAPTNSCSLLTRNIRPLPPILQLKKLIKKVSNELSSLGLNPVVLNRLLTPPDVQAAAAADSAVSRSSAAYVHPSESPSESSSSALQRQAAADDSPALEELEFEFLSEGSSSVADGESSFDGARQADAAADGADDGREGRDRTVQRWVDDTGKRFRVRVRDDSRPTDGGESGFSLADDDEDDDPVRLRRLRTRRSSGAKREAISVKGGFTAEYEIGGVSQALTAWPKQGSALVLTRSLVARPPLRLGSTSGPSHPARPHPILRPPAVLLVPVLLPRRFGLVARPVAVIVRLARV